jgi:hypothetical protein
MQVTTSKLFEDVFCQFFGGKSVRIERPGRSRAGALRDL